MYNKSRRANARVIGLVVNYESILRGTKKLPVERPRWKLAFKVPPKFPIITGEKIRDANGNPLKMILEDTDTGRPVFAPLYDELQIELVPLLGNFPRDSRDTDDFQKGIVEAKHPVLAGEYKTTMWDGRATVGEIMFTDDSLKCGCMFRIGMRVVPESYHGARILEGMTEAFMVRDRHGYELHRSENYKWQLAFQSQPRQPIYVDRQIRDVIGNPLEVILVDTETGLPLVPPTKELHIELVSLFPPYSHEEDLSADEFQKAVCTRREFEPYLSGDIGLTMKHDGRVTVNELQYTGSLEALKLSHLGHIGVRVVPGKNNGAGRIREGITHDFEIRDEEMVMKRLLPGLSDDVCWLEGISWGGVFRSRLEQNNVRNVQEFLTMLAVKPDELRAIAGDGMDDSRWSEIISHARACIFPLDKVYAYHSVRATIYVNSIFDLVKVKLGGVECPLQELDEAQKRLVQQVMQEAYEHRHTLQEVKLTLNLGDPVWRLEMIDREGASHMKLTSNNIDTVQEFLRMLHVKPDELRAIVGDDMTNRMWNVTTSHAQECESGDKVYAYSGANSTIYVDSIFLRLLMIRINGVECALSGLCKIKPNKADVVEMVTARQIILEAFEHRHNLQEVDATMEPLHDTVIHIETLLSCTKRYVQVDLDDKDDDHIHDDEVPVPQSANLDHQMWIPNHGELQHEKEDILHNLFASLFDRNLLSILDK
ncbi:hypothetical protein EJB05_26073, partial [Eragrostis curvula]